MRKLSSIIIIAIFATGIFTLLPYAFGEEPGNPISALWEAIYDLQNRDDSLQSQIDDLRVQEQALAEQDDGPLSELHMQTLVTSSNDSDDLLIEINVINDGPDRAAAVRLTLFYKMPLFTINSITGNYCQDLSRGIIRCDLGTIEPGNDSLVVIDATALERGVKTSLTLDISTTTVDKISENNHKVIDIVTGSNEVPEVEDGLEYNGTGKPDQTLPPAPDNSTSTSEATNSTESASSEPAGSAGDSDTEPPAESGSSTNSTSSENTNSEKDEDSKDTSGSDTENTDNKEGDDNENQSKEPPSSNQTSSG